ncbi:hypothetical protein [Ereboglobus sp. PH5-10]|uniref:hypothetical protein n=1 Tax=Ereboglobus sp. PH5-10 TaxID=2940629 RepID=UPI0024054F29|nr:hypothetical protein [Ereboglobus sp. PH5-10]
MKYKNGTGTPACATLFILTVALLFITGCSTTPPRPPPPAPTGDAVVDYQNQLAAASEKDRALWQYRLGLAALRRGESDIATPALDDALAISAANYGNINKAAAKSRGMFTQEASKPFVGEAYERVMANFYRGIIYWAAGEPDNARALFRTGQLLDSDTLNKEYAGDYVLLDYLDGYVSAKLNPHSPDAGADALKRARASAAAQERAAPPDYETAANVMVFVDYSPGPKKYAGGDSGQQLLYRVVPASATSARLTVGGRSHALPPYDDVSFQAITRGGRVMDQILGNKAAFKRTTDTIGDVGLIGAMAVSNSSNSKDAQIVTGALLLAGFASKIISASTRTRADTRCWDNLPRYLSFAAIQLPPGKHQAELTFFDGKGNAYTQQTQRFTITVPDPAALPIGAATKDVVIYRSQMRN